MQQKRRNHYCYLLFLSLPSLRKVKPVKDCSSVSTQLISPVTALTTYTLPHQFPPAFASQPKLQLNYNPIPLEEHKGHAPFSQKGFAYSGDSGDNFTSSLTTRAGLQHR